MSETLAHGVLLQISDLGVFLSGPAGIGKSTLALELLDRGHTLVADDVVRFTEQAGRVTGQCPAMLHGLLALRDLGVLDIRRHFGESHWQPMSPLDLVIVLHAAARQRAPQLNVVHGQHTILNHPIPAIDVVVSSHRNVALVIETAVKNYILYKQGNDANRLLKQKQQ